MKRPIQIATVLVLLFFLLQSCNKPGTNRPVKYIAYIGFNYLNTAKDSLNGYSDSLYLVALNTYLDRINETEYPVKYQLKAYQFLLESFRLRCIQTFSMFIMSK